MKKVITLVVAFAAVAVVAGSEANAQNFSFNNGFQFGAGARSAAVGNPGFGFGSGFSSFGRGFSSRQVRPPYFAEFPPVYYNGIVRRPYGISPFAAPAGVVPVELTAAAGPVERAVVKNPFFKKNKSKAVSVMETVDEDPASTKNKSTRVINRFFGSDREVVGSILHASFDVQGN